MGSVRLWTRWTRTLSSVLSRNFNVGFSVSLFHKDASCIFPSEAGSGERTAGCGKDCAQDPQKDWSLGRIKNGVLKLPTDADDSERSCQCIPIRRGPQSNHLSNSIS